MAQIASAALSDRGGDPISRLELWEVSQSFGQSRAHFGERGRLGWWLGGLDDPWWFERARDRLIIAISQAGGDLAGDDGSFLAGQVFWVGELS